jgi:hypothetical protein
MSKKSGSALLLLLVATAFVASTAACSGDPHNDGNNVAAPSPSATESIARPSSKLPPSSNPSTDFPEVPIAEKDRVLVPIFHGVGNGMSPRFVIPDRLYTVKINCVATGTKSIVVDASGEQNVPCDGEYRRLHVLEDEKTMIVKVKASSDARWSMAVVVTPDFKAKPSK